MEQLIKMHGKPVALRLNDGSKLTSIAFTEWCEQQKIELHFIQPGKPDQNYFREHVLPAWPSIAIPQSIVM